MLCIALSNFFFFFQAEDGIRDWSVTGVQTCALPISISETGLVGPATVCRDEPNRAATTVGTIAQYKPYSGGSPASVANATPCGSTTTAPINPASASAFSVERSTRGHHFRNGNNRCASGMVEAVEGVTSG